MKHIKKLSALLMCALIALSACLTASAANYDGDTLIETGETGKLTIHLYEALEPYLSQAEENKDGSTTTVTNENFKEFADGGTVKIAGIKGTSYSSTDTVDDGVAVFDNLPVGEYKVSFEASTFSTTVRSRLQGYTFDVKVPTTKADGTGFNFDVHVYPKLQAVYGKLTFTKYNGEGADGKGGTLQGVTFGVYTDEKCNNPLVNGALTNGEIITGGDGTFTLILAPGTYYLKELATVGDYILNQKVIKVVIDGTHTKVDGDGYTLKTESLINYKNTTGISKEVDDEKVVVGQTVTYTVNVTLPKGIQEGDIFKITDNLPEGLTGTGCTVYGVKSDGSEEPINLDATGTYVLTFNDSSKTKVTDLTAYEKVKVDITAKVKATEALLTSGITNRASYEYDPVNGDPIGGSSEVSVQTGSVLVNKTTSDGNGNVTQAKFKLYKDSACTQAATFYTDAALTTAGTNTEISPDASGNFTFYGLEPGTKYYLVETKAPVGYELLGEVTEVEAVAGKDTIATPIENQKKTIELPFTGGVGAEVVVASGVLLMVAACFVLKKRVK